MNSNMCIYYCIKLEPAKHGYNDQWKKKILALQTTPLAAVSIVRYRSSVTWQEELSMDYNLCSNENYKFL